MPGTPAEAPKGPEERRNGRGDPVLTDDAELALPLLSALVDVFQMCHERPAHRGARIWTDYEDRMRTIVELFRTRQLQQSLFHPPFDTHAATRILSSSQTGR